MISLYFYGTDNIIPGTDEQSLERRDNYHEFREAPVAGVRQVNPHKHLEAAPIAPCQSGITAGTKRRGMNVNDQIKLARGKSAMLGCLRIQVNSIGSLEV